MFPFLIKSELHEHHATKVEHAAEFMSNYDTFIFDADGVLWRGPLKIEGSDVLLNQLINAGKRVLILTNNSTKTAIEIALKCQKLGFTSVSFFN